jgi:hypothetical protein
MKFVIFVAVVAMSCTDTARGVLTRYGSSAKVTCYSGGQVVFDDESTGAVQSSENSDGYLFVSKKTGSLVEVSGTCTLKY